MCGLCQQNHIGENMTNLITTAVKTVTMTSVEIAELTGKNHSDVMRDIRNEIEQLGEEISESIFALSEYQGSRRMEKCYELTRDGVLQLGARYDAKIRFTLIQRMNQLESQIRVPQTYKEALLDIIRIEEEKEVLMIENNKKQDKINLLTHVNKLYTTTEIAKELNMKSAIELNKQLHNDKIQYKVNNTWVLSAQYSNLGYKSIKQNVLDNGAVVYDRKWTQEGRDFILEMYKK